METMNHVALMSISHSLVCQQLGGRAANSHLFVAFCQFINLKEDDALCLSLVVGGS